MLLAISATLTTPGVAESAPAPQQSIARVHGTVTDLRGEPLEVCVYVRQASPSPVDIPGLNEDAVGQVFKGLTDPETGAYSFEVPPGTYDVWAYWPFTVSASWPEPCRDPFWSRINSEGVIEEGPRRVSTIGGGQLDFALRYYLAGGAYGRHCCTGSAVRPGEAVDLLTWTSRLVRGEARVFWKDLTSGTEVELPRDGPMWIDLYDTYGCVPRLLRCTGGSPETKFTMPTDDGWYPYRFWVEGLDGNLLSYVYEWGTWVDSIPPVLTSASPADGSDTMVSAHGDVLLDVRADDSTSGVWTVRASVRDLANPATPVFNGYLSSWDNQVFSKWIPVEANRDYEVTYTLRDQADNITTEIVTFHTTPHVPPCSTLQCRADQLLSDLVPTALRAPSAEMIPGRPISPSTSLG